MAKVKKISINGVSYEVDDENAAQLPEETNPQDGDVLTYSSTEQKYVPKSQSEFLKVDTNFNSDSNNPISNKAVSTGCEKKKKQVELYANYNSNNHRVQITSIIDGKSSDARADDNIYLSYYLFEIYNDPVTDEMQLSKFTGNIEIIPIAGQYVNLNVDFGSFPVQRNLMLFVSNPVTANEIVILRTPIINIPVSGVVNNYINVTQQNGTSKSTDIILTPTVALSDDIYVRVTVRETGFNDIIINRNLTIGTTIETINIGSSAQTRQVIVEITQNSDSSPCVLSTSILQVSGRLNTMELYFHDIGTQPATSEIIEQDGEYYFVMRGRIDYPQNDILVFTCNRGDSDNPMNPREIVIDPDEEGQPSQDDPLDEFYFWNTEGGGWYQFGIKIDITQSNYSINFSYDSYSKGGNEQIVFDDINFNYIID